MNPVAMPWQTRVIPNRYPALGSVSIESMTSDPHTLPGYGRHEVIIDCPEHHMDIPEMSDQSVEMLLATYIKRYHEIREDDPSLLPIVFRNRGPRAGASLRHAHSQILAVPIAPSKIREEEAAARACFEEIGRCPYCDEMEWELEEGVRLVYQNEHYVAFVPYAASASHEVRIVPRLHRADFGDISIAERRGLASALIATLSMVRSAASGADYNFVIVSSTEYHSTAPHLHWYIRIVPRVAQPGGFEAATGIPINPSSPEHDATRLRTAAA
jgi:UDPglucose--hexose-1-phosphate uridylyltransferase